MITLRTLALCSLLAALVLANVSPYPFRPGYGIGSWIEPDVVMEMKKEAAIRSRITLADRMQADAESVARELQMAGHPIESDEASQTIPRALSDAEFKKNQDELTEFRQDIWAVKLEAYTSLWDMQKGYLKTLKAAGKTGDARGAPTTFAAGIESPIQWSFSPLTYKDRGFNSLVVNAHFLKVNKMTEKSTSAAEHSRRVGSSVRRDLWWWSGNSASSSASQSASKTTNTMKFHQVEYTLILTCYTTHNKVKQFETYVVDPDKVLNAWNYYHRDEPIPNPSGNEAAFLQMFLAERTKATQQAQDKEKAKTINLVTESFLGSSFTGMVHFLKQEVTSTSQGDSGGSSSAASTSNGLRFGLWAASTVGSTSASAKSTMSKMASLASASKLDVTFDLVVQGYIPTIKSKPVLQTVEKFSKFDPASMSTGSDLPQSKVEAAGKAQNVQQSNQDSVIKATLQGVTPDTDTVQVLDLATFMEAFDDFTEAAKKAEEGIGVPIGLNLVQYTRYDVMVLLAELYLPGGKNYKPRNADGATGGGGGGSGGEGEGGAATS